MLLITSYLRLHHNGLQSLIVFIALIHYNVATITAISPTNPPMNQCPTPQFEPNDTCVYNISMKKFGDARLQIGCKVNLLCEGTFYGEFLSFKRSGSKEVNFTDEVTQRTKTTTTLQVPYNYTIGAQEFICYNASRKSVNTTKLFFGTPPENVTDFNCISNDFDNLICNFTVPINFVTVDYNVTVQNDNNPPQNIICSRIKSDRSICQYNGFKYWKEEMVCTMTSNVKPWYASHYKMFTFTVRSTNALGELTQTFKVDDSDVVIPAKPKITMMSESDGVITVKWQFHKPGSYPCVKYQLVVGPMGLPGENRIIEGTTTSRSHEDIAIQENKYAYYIYNISLRIHGLKENCSNANATTATSKYWSKPFIDSILTQSRQPDKPPATNEHAFNINSTHITLHWQAMPKHEQNAEHFQYLIEQKETHLREFVTTPTISILLASLNISSNHDFALNFDISASNANGTSNGKSTIRAYHNRAIDAILQTFNASVSMTGKYGNYTLFWQRPELRVLQDYTIFWYLEDFTDLNFETIDKNAIDYTFPQLNEKYKLAIAANYHDFSTGMLYPKCIMLAIENFLFKSPTISPNTTSLTIHWSIGRICEHQFEYKIKWSPAKVQQQHAQQQQHDDDDDDDDAANCRSITFNSTTYSNYTINNLEPNTEYNMILYVYIGSHLMESKKFTGRTISDNTGGTPTEIIILIIACSVIVSIICVKFACWLYTIYKDMSELGLDLPDALKDHLAGHTLNGTIDGSDGGYGGAGAGAGNGGGGFGAVNGAYPTYDISLKMPFNNNPNKMLINGNCFAYNQQNQSLLDNRNDQHAGSTPTTPTTASPASPGFSVNSSKMYSSECDGIEDATTQQQQQQQLQHHQQQQKQQQQPQIEKYADETSLSSPSSSSTSSSTSSTSITNSNLINNTIMYDSPRRQTKKNIPKGTDATPILINDETPETGGIANTASSGYITLTASATPMAPPAPPSVPAPAPVQQNCNGYVTQQTLLLMQQQPPSQINPQAHNFNISGYTTLDAIERATAPLKSRPTSALDDANATELTPSSTISANTNNNNNNNNTNHNNNNNNNDKNLICGYVTQRQLTELGHINAAGTPLPASVNSNNEPLILGRHHYHRHHRD